MKLIKLQESIEQIEQRIYENSNDFLSTFIDDNIDGMEVTGVMFSSEEVEVYYSTEGDFFNKSFPVEYDDLEEWLETHYE